VELRARAAWIEAKRGQMNKAIDAMRAVVEENTGYFWAWQQLADWLWRSDQQEEAVEAATQMARIAPLNPIPFGYRGQLKLRRRDPKGARADFEHAFQLDPTYAFAGLNLFDLQLNASEFGAAAHTLDALRKHVGGEAVTVREARLRAKQLKAQPALALDALP
jgi:tetratricopeptide (TPR) repeat protein